MCESQGVKGRHFVQGEQTAGASALSSGDRVHHRSCTTINSDSSRHLPFLVCKQICVLVLPNQIPQTQHSIPKALSGIGCCVAKHYKQVGVWVCVPVLTCELPPVGFPTATPLPRFRTTLAKPGRGVVVGEPAGECPQHRGTKIQSHNVHTAKLRSCNCLRRTKHALRALVL